MTDLVAKIILKVGNARQALLVYYKGTKMIQVIAWLISVYLTQLMFLGMIAFIAGLLKDNFWKTKKRFIKDLIPFYFMTYVFKAIHNFLDSFDD